MLDEIESVILDIDGTLVNSKEFYRRTLKKVLNSNYNFFFRRFYLAILKEEHYQKLVLALWEKLNILIYEIFDKLEKSPPLFRGVRQFLEKLSENEVKVFASTAGSKSLKVEQKLEKLGILDFFEKVLGREVAKAEHAYLFARYLNMDVREFSRHAIYIGDELMDMILAKKFGIYGIGITNTFSDRMLREFGAKMVINNFEELTELYTKNLLKEIK